MPPGASVAVPDAGGSVTASRLSVWPVSPPPALSLARTSASPLAAPTGSSRRSSAAVGGSLRSVTVTFTVAVALPPSPSLTW